MTGHVSVDAARAAFLDAWAAHDTACGGSRGRPSSLTFVRETGQVSDALAVYADAVGLDASNTLGMLHALRRAGFDHGGALRALELVLADRR